MKSDIYWSEMGSGFRELDGTRLPMIPRNTAPPSGIWEAYSVYYFKVLYSLRMQTYFRLSLVYTEK